VPRQNNLGVPVSSWGTLEYNRVGLTMYSIFVHVGLHYDRDSSLWRARVVLPAIKEIIN
jgi:hypothetical protein